MYTFEELQQKINGLHSGHVVTTEYMGTAMRQIIYQHPDTDELITVLERMEFDEKGDVVASDCEIISISEAI